MHLRTLLLLFFFSGAAALAYEVVWIRLLSLTLSITVYALTTVLCSFMAGLGLGAAAAARLADRVRRPMVVFGLAELGIAASGLVVPAVLYNLGPAYVWLHESLGGEGLAFTLSRFLLAFSVLLVPTTLMGVTLPLLSRAIIDRREVVGRRAGWLYAVNTFGAVAGTVLAGFLLIPALGLWMTSLTAAAVNVGVGLFAIGLGWRSTAPVTGAIASQHRPRLTRPAKIAATAFAVSGFTAMGYEVLWTRSLEHYTHNSTYAYTAMLAMFLAGLALGSAIAARLADGLRRPLLALGAVQIGIGLSVVAALSVYIRFETLLPEVARMIGGLGSWPRVVGLIFGEATVTLFATTLLFGATFPLVARVVVDELGAVGNRVGVAYVANTVGSILGAFLVGFMFLPAMGIRWSFLFLVATNISLGGLLIASEVARRTAAWVAAGIVVVGLATLILIPHDFLENQFAQRYGALLFYREGVTDTVMVTEDAQGARMIRYSDGRGTAGTGTVIEDRTYAHIPMLLHENPRRVLQIGFGVGNTLSSVVQYPVEHATCVELSPGVRQAASYFSETNRDVLNDPRVTLVINDGRNFLLADDEKYDVIRLDPPELHTAGVVNLYTKEFYELARDHLAPGGIFSIWVNFVMTPEEGLRMILRTMSEVFPHVSVWHGPAAYSWVINASMLPHELDLSRLTKRFQDPKVSADLATIGIHDPFQLLFHFVFTGDAVKAYMADAPIVVDDHTRLDFDTPRSLDAFYGVANVNTDYWLLQLVEPGSDINVAANLYLRKVGELAKQKRPVLPHLTGVEAAGFDRAEIEDLIRPARILPPSR